MTQRAGVLFAIVVATASPAAAQPSLDGWPRPELKPGLSEPEIAASIAAYAQQLADTGRFSGVVLAANAGKVVLARGYGLADRTAHAPNTLDTRFNLGSITKLFTRVAIAQLAQAGVLGLDDTVRKHLPALAIPSADRITIRQLLDHRSGMGDIFGPKYDAAPPARLRELADFVPLFANQPLAFAPGTDERYSNAGYVTVGLIVERVSGMTYRDYVAKHVFAPANMASSGLWALDEPVANRAVGYTPNGPNTLSGRPTSAGGSMSTAGDLLRFWDALTAGKLVNPTWTAWMLQGPSGPPPAGADARRPAKRRIGFGGGAPGVNAALEVSGSWTVIVLANLSPPAAAAVGHAAVDIIRGEPDLGPFPGGGVHRTPPLDHGPP
jgi:D-alanyl-D-alanine carboxypeptidase